MRDAGRWMMAEIEHVFRSAQNVAASSHYVRSERSPLHDVRQHAHARAPRGALNACADSCLRTSHRAHSRTSIQNETSITLTAGGARRDRTDDLLLAKQALSQLSYGPFRWLEPGVGDRSRAGQRPNLTRPNRRSRYLIAISDP